MRVSQEFHEEKVFVKIKSFSFEKEYEFEYKDISEISDGRITNTSQMNASFWALLAETMAIAYFNSYVCNYPLLLQVARIIFILTFILLVTSFKKTLRVYISDMNDNVLSHIDYSTRNRDFIPQIIQMIKNKSPNLIETSIINPFPKNEANFEYVQHDYTQFSETTERFYDDRMIGYQKGIYSDFIYQIQYNQIAKKADQIKKTKDVTGDVMWLCGILMISLIGPVYLFDLQFRKQLLYLFFVIAGMVIISVPLSLIKHEIVGLLDNKGKVLYWTYVTRKNKAQIDKIFEFICSKIPTTENN